MSSRLRKRKELVIIEDVPIRAHYIVGDELGK